MTVPATSVTSAALLPEHPATTVLTVPDVDLLPLAMPRLAGKQLSRSDSSWLAPPPSSFSSTYASRLAFRLTIFHVNSAPKEDNGRDEDGSVNPGSNLFVTGIHPRLTEAEVTRLFEKYGEVEKCQIMKDPHTKESRGFGFVKMVTSEQADAAKEGLQDEEIEGRSLSIEKARRARPRTPTPGKYFGPPKRGQCLVLPAPLVVYINSRVLQRTGARGLTTVVVVEATVADMVAVAITVVATVVVMILIATVEAEVTIALVMMTVVIAATARTGAMTVAIVTIEAAILAAALVPLERIAMTVDTSAAIALTTATAVLIVTVGLVRIVSAMLLAGGTRGVALVMTEIATTALIAMLNEPVTLLPPDMPNPAPEPRPVNLTPVPPNLLATKSLRPGHCC